MKKATLPATALIFGGLTALPFFAAQPHDLNYEKRGFPGFGFMVSPSHRKSARGALI